MREAWKAAAVADLRAHFAGYWASAFARAEDHTVALAGPSAYVLDADETRIVIDPSFRFPWLREQVEGRFAQDLAAADGVFITHIHGDHFDAELLRALRGKAARVYFPSFFDREMVRSLGLADSQTIFVEPGERIRCGKLWLTAFYSPHFDVTGTLGVPELGYLVETSRRRLLFPVDVRNYDPARLPPVGEADAVFMHVWMGRANALNPPFEPYPEQFARFALSCRPEKVFLAHLYEIGRTLDEMWTYTHAGILVDALYAADPGAQVVVPRLGRRYPV